MLATFKQILTCIALVYLCTSWNENAHKFILCEQFEKGRILISFFLTQLQRLCIFYIKIHADSDYTQFLIANFIINQILHVFTLPSLP